MHPFVSGLVWWPTFILVTVATFTDVRSRRIPNWLVLSFLVVGIGVSSWLRGWHGILQSLAGTMLGLLLYGIIFWMGGMGAGDVKLSAAIGALIGPHQLFIALIITGLAGGLMALCWAACGGFLNDLFAESGNLIFGWMRRGRGMPRDLEQAKTDPMKRRMPYAPAIAIGTLISFFAC